MSTPSDEPDVRSLFDLRGKAALVTGACGYLGRAVTTALAEAGATVVASSRDLLRAQQLAESLPAPNAARHHGVSLDHMQEESLNDGIDRAIELTGGLDILINNGHDPLGADWRDVTPEQFQRHLGNVVGYFLLARRLRDHAVERSVGANIVMLGSIYGIVGSYPDAYQGISSASPAAYHALKGGIVQLTRHLAVYWARDQVRVNCLCPGAFPNPERVPEPLIHRLSEKTPMGRIGSAHELKGVAVFLASEASSYMTGQTLIVDGGWTAW